MSVALLPHPGETILAHSPVPDSTLTKNPPLRFGFLVTSAAIYVPVLRDGIHLRESLESRRIPLSELRGVSLRPVSVWNSLLLVNVVLLFNALVLLTPLYIEQGHRYTAVLLPAILALSVVRAFHAGDGRWRLELRTSSGPVQFTPAASDVGSSKAKAEALALQRAFLDACPLAGITVEATNSPAAVQGPA
jgi:hypothetical protein